MTSRLVRNFLKPESRRVSLKSICTASSSSVHSLNGVCSLCHWAFSFEGLLTHMGNRDLREPVRLDPRAHGRAADCPGRGVDHRTVPQTTGVLAHSTTAIHIARSGR